MKLTNFLIVLLLVHSMIIVHAMNDETKQFLLPQAGNSYQTSINNDNSCESALSPLAQLGVVFPKNEKTLLNEQEIKELTNYTYRLINARNKVQITLEQARELIQTPSYQSDDNNYSIAILKKSLHDPYVDRSNIIRAIKYLEADIAEKQKNDESCDCFVCMTAPILWCHGLFGREIT